MDLYDRINEQLNAMNKTRKDLCEATGISYNTLTSQFQRRSLNIGVDNIVKISQYLNVTAEYLITGKIKHLALKEDRGYVYNSKSDLILVNDLNRIYHSLSLKNRTLLLARAYELEKEESN